MARSHHGPECSRRRARAVQLRAAHRLLPRRLLRERRRRPRRALRVRSHDQRVPRVLPGARQRPQHADARARLPRARARRPVVPLRVTLAGGVRGGHGAVASCSRRRTPARSSGAPSPRSRRTRRRPDRWAPRRSRPPRPRRPTAAAASASSPGRSVSARISTASPSSTPRTCGWCGRRPNYPTYYFPLADVRNDLLHPTGERRRSPSRGDASCSTSAVGDRVAPVGRVPPCRFAARGAPRAGRVHVEPRWTTGSKKTKRCTCTRATRTRASTSCPSSRFGAGRDRRRRRRGVRPPDACCSRPGCRRATTSRRPTCGSTCSSRPTPRARAPTRGRRATGR